MTLFKIDVEEKLNDFPNNEIEHLNDSFETNIPVNEPSNELYSPVNTILSNLSKQQVDINLDSNTNLRFVKYFVGETIRMRCIIPEGSHVVSHYKCKTKLFIQIVTKHYLRQYFQLYVYIRNGLFGI